MALSLPLLLMAVPHAHAAPEPRPLRIAIVGLVHGHVRGFLERIKDRPDVQLVALVDPDKALLEQYRQRYGLAPERAHPSLEGMLDSARPEAVAVFTSTYDHPRVVEACAARGIHVMMEKPLAVSIEHGRRMAEAAARGRIHVFVNYETTWYPSNPPSTARCARARSAPCARWWRTTVTAVRGRSACSPSSWPGSPIPS